MKLLFVFDVDRLGIEMDDLNNLVLFFVIEGWKFLILIFVIMEDFKGDNFFDIEVFELELFFFILGLIVLLEWYCWLVGCLFDIMYFCVVFEVVEFGLGIICLVGFCYVLYIWFFWELLVCIFSFGILE